MNKNELIRLYSGLALAGIAGETGAGQTAPNIASRAVELAENVVALLEKKGYLGEETSTLECTNGQSETQAIA